MSERIMCAGCGALLFGQWWDYDRRGFDCQRCHALTAADGTLMAAPSERPKPSARTRGWLFVALVILLAVLVYVSQQLG